LVIVCDAAEPRFFVSGRNLSFHSFYHPHNF
jgi:hypothetical protein